MSLQRKKTFKKKMVKKYKVAISLVLKNSLHEHYCSFIGKKCVILLWIKQMKG